MQCSRCRKLKPLSEFYFRKDQNKYRTNCKDCISKNGKQRYASNPDIFKEKAKKYYFSNWDIAQVRRSKWRKNNPEKIKEAIKKYAQSDKGKIAAKKSLLKWEARPDTIMKKRAHWVIKGAIKAGKLIRPSRCELCNYESPSPIQAHHHRGYSKENQLVVLWLCPQCHNYQHNK